MTPAVIGPDEAAAILRDNDRKNAAILRETLPYPRFPISQPREDYTLYLHESKHAMMVWTLVAWDGMGDDVTEHQAWCRITDAAIHELQRPLRDPEARLVTHCVRDMWGMKQTMRRHAERREAAETAERLHDPFFGLH